MFRTSRQSLSRKARLAVQNLEERATPAVFMVTSGADSGAGTLRQAVLDADASPGADTVNFNLPSRSISLASAVNVIDDVAIVGPTDYRITISSNGASRILDFFGNGPSSVANLNLVGGKASFGGAIALDNGASLTVESSTLSGNTAIADGGAIWIADYYCDLSVKNSLIIGNVAGTGGTGSGGAIWTQGNLTIDSSTITGNSVVASNFGYGGALSLVEGDGCTWLIRNSTIVGNIAKTSAGGISLAAADAIFIVQNSTIANNVAQAGLGGGIARLGDGSTIITLASSVVSGNTGGASSDISTAGIVNATVSAIGSAAGIASLSSDSRTQSLFGQNLKLSTLGGHGGPTLTIVPLTGSPLIDVGSNPAALTTDQRGAGYSRSRGGLVDIGAAEYIAPIIVTNDSNAGVGSLRQAVLDANASVGPDTITFDSGFFNVARVINLTSEIGVSDVVRITGPGASLLTLSGGNANRILNLSAASAGNDIALSGLKFSQGHASNFGGAIFSIDESLTATDCVFVSNTAAARGGAISIGTGNLTLNRCTLENNSSQQGGAVQVDNNGMLTVQNSLFAGNTSTTSTGGAIRFGGNRSITIVNSTFSANVGAYGGAVALTAFSGTASFLNSTFTLNSTGNDGGTILRYSGTSVINLESCIISGNTAAGSGPDIFTTGVANLTSCLLGSPAGMTTLNQFGTTGSILGQPAKLLPLANNGGATKTHALAWDSPALTRGTIASSGVSVDQRGKSRSGSIEIGAFEMQPPTRVDAVAVGDGKAQRSVVTQLKVTFKSPVAFVGSPAAAFTLVRQSDGQAVNLAVAMNATNTVATITFTGGTVDGQSLADGRYTLTALANQFNADGLDGNNNGLGGDDYILVGNTTAAPKLYRLFGDHDGDGDTDLTDFTAFRQSLGSSSTSGKYNAAFDFDGDGNIDLYDFLQFRARLGVTP